MKLAVIGVGGVGGYLAGMLSSHGADVTVVARGERGEALRRGGLVLHSEYKGEMVAHPQVVAGIGELDHADVIFICVKNYSLEGVCEELGSVLRGGEILVPVMNGVDPGDRVRQMLPGATVVDSLIYVVSFAAPDYSIIQQGAYANLRLGSMTKDKEETEAAKKVRQILLSADIDVPKAEDIRVEIWRKYILNCAYNVLTAAYDTTIGPLRKDRERAAEYEALVEEAYELGLALGVPLLPEYKKEIIRRFYEDYGDDAGSSLQRDVHAGRKAETETFSGYVVKTSARLGLKLPVSERMYEKLKSADAGRKA